MTTKDTRPGRAKKSKDKKQTTADDPPPGWPGYRTRAGRSGYDPIDTRTEAAHTAGTLIQRLFTGHIRNPVHLLLLGVLGLVLISPLVLAITEARDGNIFPWNAWIILGLAGIVGLLILINFIRNFIQMIGR